VIIEIITDGSPAIGYGHLRRSTTLSWNLKSSGHQVRVVKASADPDEIMPEAPSDEGIPDRTVIDLPYSGDPWIDRNKFPGTKFIGMDFSGSVRPDAIISIIDRNMSPECLNRFSGLEYAIIRNDIRRLAPAGEGKGIIVCIGGGDLLGIGVEISASLAVKFDAVTLIEGPLVNPSENRSDQFQIIQNPDDFADRLAGCLWAVTNGGSLMMEMMCMGKPVHVVPQTPQEEELSNYVFSLGGILGVGRYNISPPGAQQIQEVSEIARNLVDGHGPDRIIRIIENLN